jgi:hypothetical protein
VDRDCSNEEYLDLLSGGNKETREVMSSQVKDWNFQFADVLPIGPYILFKEMSGSTSVAPGGGHATYAGPREKTFGFIVAIQLDRKENLHYHKEPKEKDYSEGVEGLDLDFWESLSNEGKKLDTYRTTAPYSYQKPGYNTGQDWKSNHYGSSSSPSIPSNEISDLELEKMQGWEISP